MRISLQACTTLILSLCLPETKAFISPISIGKSQFNALNTFNYSRRLTPSILSLNSCSSDGEDRRSFAGSNSLFHEFLTASLFGFILTFCPMVNSNNPMDRVLVARADDALTVTKSQISNENGEAKSITEESLLTAPSKKESADITVVEEVWSLINKYFIDQTFNGQDWNEVKKSYYSQISPSDDDEKALQVVTKMTKSLGDKYSRILDSNQYQAIQKYDLIGIGATLMPDQQKHIIVGAPPVPGSASDRAGLKVGDYIAAVNGVPTDGRSAFDIIDQISEDPNAKTITMTVKREGNEGQEGFTNDITMERAFAEVRNPIQFKVSETRKDGTKVGYVRIVEFNGIVKAKLEEAIHTLEKDGVNAYVIDVRGNPGGAFQSAVEISSLFLDDRIATYVIDSNQAKLPFRTASGSVLVDSKDPIAIWIDRNSASASEVFTGSLHDNCRAVVMGENSFGKGKIQAVYGLKDGAGLVLTVAKYVTPSGTDIQGAGIHPDIEVDLPPSFVPVLSSDTTKVDFEAISSRLSMCQIPSSI